MDQTKNDSCQKTWSAVPVLGDHGKTRIGFSYIDLYSFLSKLSWLCSTELDAKSPASNRFAASNPSKTRPGKIASQQPTKTAGLVKKHGKSKNLHRGHRGLKRGRVNNFCRVFFPKPLWIYNFNMRQKWFQGILFTYSWALATWTLFSLALWLATRDPGVFCLLPVSRSLAASNTCIICDQILRYSSIHSHPQAKPWTSNNETLHQKWQK